MAGCAGPRCVEHMASGQFTTDKCRIACGRCRPGRPLAAVPATTTRALPVGGSRARASASSSGRAFEQIWPIERGGGSSKQQYCVPPVPTHAGAPQPRAPPSAAWRKRVGEPILPRRGCFTQNYQCQEDCIGAGVGDLCADNGRCSGQKKRKADFASGCDNGAAVGAFFKTIGCKSFKRSVRGCREAWQCSRVRRMFQAHIPEPARMNVKATAR